MPDVLTPIYDFTEPEIGGSDDTWGEKLNANWAKIDLLLGQAFTGGDFDTIGVIKTSVLPDSDSAPYVRKAGSTMSGNLSIETATSPGIIYGRTPNAVSLKHWGGRIEATSGHLVFRPLDDSKANLAGAVSMMRDAAGITDMQVVGGPGWNMVPQSDNSVLTRGRGDGRYLPLAGGTVGGDLTMPHIRLTATTDASLTSTGHAFQIGPDTGDNLRLDANEIYAVKNGAASALYLNASSINLEAPVVHTPGTIDATVFKAPADATFGFSFANGAGFAVNASGNVSVKGADHATNYMYYGGDGGPSTAASGIVILSRKMADARYTMGVTAGNGMTGGGSEGVLTVHMGTPSSITTTSTSTTTADSHSHALSASTVLALVADGALGGVGTYALLRRTVAGMVKPGTAVAGSGLSYATSGGRVDHPGQYTETHPGGTWMSMGLSTSYDGYTDHPEDSTTLYMRIA